MIELLVAQPLLLLFVVAAIGYAIGRVRVGGTSLGIAAVLFVGLAVGALDPRLQLPEFVYLFGLVLFVYTIGLAGGPAFVASLRRRGLRDNAFVLAMILVGASLTWGAHVWLHLSPALTAGLFAGSLTNTPALAAVLERVGHAPGGLAEPVVAYSVAYPFGVVGMILAIAMTRGWRAPARAEEQALREMGATRERLEVLTIRVARPEATGVPVGALFEQHGVHALLGRLKRAGHVSVVAPETALELGDLVTAVGPETVLARVTSLLGVRSSETLELDRQELDFRRVFVSSRRAAGKRIGDMDLLRRFGAVVSRVRRGDIDLLPDDDTVLELGDRVRVLAPRERLAEVSRYFGDSYRALAEVDPLTFGVGIALGLFLGLVPVPLPNGTVLRLGLAGGPLVAGLVLGALGRTGPVLWQIPFSASLTLRQLGLILFLAGVGTRSGWVFASTFRHGGGPLLFAAGAVITAVTALLTLWIGARRLGIPRGVLAGMLAGLQTQPAVLAFANEESGDELPNVGYATVYPVAMLSKILIAQLLISLAR